MVEDLGRLREAEEHYLEAMRINPQHALAHNNYALLLAGLGPATLPGSPEGYATPCNLEELR